MANFPILTSKFQTKKCAIKIVNCTVSNQIIIEWILTQALKLFNNQTLTHPLSYTKTYAKNSILN